MNTTGGRKRSAPKATRSGQPRLPLECSACLTWRTAAHCDERRRNLQRMKKPNGGADSKCRRTVAKLRRGGFQAEGRGFKSRRPLHKSPGLSRRFAHSRSQSLPEKIALPPLLEPPPIPKLALGRWKTIITYCVGLTVRGVKLPRPRFSVPLIAVVRGEAQFCWQWSDNHRRGHVSAPRRPHGAAPLLGFCWGYIFLCCAQGICKEERNTCAKNPHGSRGGWV